MKKEVRILLVGDPQVGKSSLITSLIREQFIEDVPAVVPEVTIPPEVSPEQVTTYIVDSSSKPVDKDVLEEEIKRASVVCIVYDVSRQETFERISSFWLPYLRTLVGPEIIPVILVGNKIDTRGTDTSTHGIEEDIYHPIMQQFKEVETCVETSAESLINISEVFYYSQKAVLHPTAPLYDAAEHELKPACINALKRIFRLCDEDKDNVLNDEELNAFQAKCFNAPLQQQELEGVKEVVREHAPEGVNAHGLTERGFLFLQKLFIQRGRLETTWTILRKFGYSDELCLREDFLHPELTVGGDQSTELSSKGYQFFTELFKIFDKDNDGALSPKELSELFYTSPGCPWKVESDSCVTTAAGWITLQGFLAQWSMITLVDVRKTLEYLAYLGYPEDTLSAIKITRSRKIDIKKRKTSRNVFQCFVFGATGSGKSSLLRNLIGKPVREKYSPTVKNHTVVNAVSVKGAEKYLVLQEIPANGIDLEIIQNKKRLEECSVACFVYDASDPNSFSYVAKLQSRLDDYSMPCLFIATKNDLPVCEQKFSHQPEEFCKELDLPAPASVSVKTGNMSDLFSSISNIAMNPHLGTPALDVDGSTFGTQLLKTSVSLAAILATGYIAYRVYNQSR
eukprot:Nk52_evm30s1444 gene=Nk52_evmTU30s1444